MVATAERPRLRRRRSAEAVSPKEFCRALWEQRHVQADPTSPTGIRTLQLGILLSHFIRHDPSPEAFEVELEELADDERPRRSMLRLAARQVLRLWRARRWTRAHDGRLTIRERRPRPAWPAAV